MLTKVRVDLLLDEEAIAFLKEETKRRNLKPVARWKWRELAGVRASVMLEDWIKEQKDKQRAAAAARNVLATARTSEDS